VLQCVAGDSTADIDNARSEGERGAERGRGRGRDMEMTMSI